MNNNQNLNDLTNKFDDLIKEDNLNINSVEELMIENIENLLKKHIDEKELISKKEVWKEKGYILKNQGKEKLEFILIIGKVIIYRTILQFVGDINIENII